MKNTKATRGGLLRRPACIPALLAALLMAFEYVPARASAEGFALGVDVSELIAQENSGAVYYDAAGRSADALALLAASGATHVRLRVWNDPFDERGRGYGGGNINAETAAMISARAAGLGMKTLLDFHYSDFWADPSRQIEPKAWAGMSLSKKKTALAAYTRETLALILDAGGDVDMVQVGNETNWGMAGEYDLDAMAQLIAAGCGAVRKTAAERKREIRVCVHLADPQDSWRIYDVLTALNRRGADYDAVGVSYYPYWHGSLENLKEVIRSVRNDFGREAFVAETAWPFTLKDGDGFGNVIDYDPGIYPLTKKGQAQEFEDVCRAVSDAGGTGVFYWGGIWTPVGSNAGKNRTAWAKWGSGWATRYAHSYDPEHVPNETGGSAWDNQAMFDFKGRMLPVLDAMKRFADEIGTAAARREEVPPASGAEAANLLLNPGFEEADRSMWEAFSDTADIPFDYQDYAGDAHSGTTAFHFWSEKDMSFHIRQMVSGLEFGKYQVSVWSQGGDMKNASMELYVIADGQYYRTSFMNTVWADWQHPVIRNIPVTGGTVTIGVKIQCGKGSWGTLDDFSLTRMP